MKIRTAASRPIGHWRAQRELQDCLAAEVYAEILTIVAGGPLLPGSFGALVLEELATGAADDETLYLPYQERGLLLSAMSFHQRLQRRVA